MVSSKKILAYVFCLTLATSVILVEAQHHGRGGEGVGALLAAGILTLLLLENNKGPKLGGHGLGSSFGGLGHSSLFGGSGHSSLLGGSGHSSLFGGSGHSNLFGGSGHSNLFGGLGHSSPFGGAGHLLPFSHRNDGLLGALRGPSHSRGLGFLNPRSGGILQSLAPRHNSGILKRISGVFQPQSIFQPRSPFQVLLDPKPSNIFGGFGSVPNFRYVKKGGLPFLGNQKSLLGHNALFGSNSLLGHNSLFNHGSFLGSSSLLGQGSLFGGPPTLLGSLEKPGIL